MSNYIHTHCFLQCLVQESSLADFPFLPEDAHLEINYYKLKPFYIILQYVFFNFFIYTKKISK